MGRDHQGQGEAYVPPQLSAKQQCESVPKNVGAFLCVSGAQWEAELSLPIQQQQDSRVGVLFLQAC